MPDGSKVSIFRHLCPKCLYPTCRDNRFAGVILTFGRQTAHLINEAQVNSTASVPNCETVGINLRDDADIATAFEAPTARLIGDEPHALDLPFVHDATDKQIVQFAEKTS